MTARELAFWTGPHAGRVQFAHSTEAGEIAALARAHEEGRVTTFTGYCELGDGFGLLEVGGHTPGQLIARVAVTGGEVVLAADALHFYDELTRDRPFFVVADLEAMYAGFDTLRDITDRAGPGARGRARRRRGTPLPRSRAGHRHRRPGDPTRGGGAPDMTTVGVIGLGNMGGRMARRLVDAGWEVVGHDPVAGRAEEVGAEAVGSPAEVARRCATVLLSLPDSTVVEPVVRDLLTGAAPGTTVVDLSTASPESTVALAAEAAARDVAYLDAGISGGAAAAEKGTLTIMAGGDAAAVDAIRPVLAPLAATVHHLGPVGAGHTAKLLNNFLNAVTLAATAEVMVAGQRAGPGPAHAARGHQRRERAVVRLEQPVPAHRRGRLPRGRAHQPPDDQGRHALHRAARAPRRALAQRRGPGRLVRHGRAPRLRRRHLQPRRGRPRRPRRRCPDPAAHD